MSKVVSSTEVYLGLAIKQAGTQKLEAQQLAAGLQITALKGDYSRTNVL